MGVVSGSLQLSIDASVVGDNVVLVGLMHDDWQTDLVSLLKLRLKIASVLKTTNFGFHSRSSAAPGLVSRFASKYKHYFLPCYNRLHYDIDFDNDVSPYCSGGGNKKEFA
jgi:hypothetical protein